MQDIALKKLVEDELDWDPSIDPANVGVTVDNGVVRLTGRVQTYNEKIAVEAAIKRIKGVRGYVEDLEVQYTKPVLSDQSVAERVLHALDWDVRLPKDAIKVKVEDGRVTLTGEVKWRYQRDAAQEAISPLYGVRGINNHIAVKPAASAVDVKRRIEDALKRRADFEADRITVTVEGDKVRLDGKVRGWFERDLAERAAWAAPGVRKVEDHVAIGL